MEFLLKQIDAELVRQLPLGVKRFEGVGKIRLAAGTKSTGVRMTATYRTWRIVIIDLAPGRQ